MLVYKAEIEAGIADKVKASGRLAFASLAELAEPFDLSEHAKAFLATATNKNQPDLHYLKTILVTTGWNKNDDVFDRTETWIARATPEDKPFNYEHDQSDIIGHITDCFAIDKDNKVLASDSTIDDVPDKFHIVTGAVLYKEWEDADKQKRMDRIIAEIAKGKWFVSMEALFNNFDYALVENGKARVIARNENTAFLTKHLRIYGGDGKYNGARVGRLLRNFVFSGKGLVAKPANPESIIFKETETFSAASADLVYSTTSGKTEINKVPTPIEDTLESLRKENEQLKAALKDADEKEWSKKVDGLTETVKAKDGKIAELEKDAAAKAEEVKTLKSQVEKFESEFKTVADELSEIKAAKKRVERVSVVKSKLELADDKAEAFVSKTDKLSDEDFAATVEIQHEAIAAMKPKLPPTVSNEPAPQGKPPEQKPAGNINKPTSPVPAGATQTKTSADVLENVEPVVQPSLATPTELVDAGIDEELQSEVNKYFDIKE